MDDILDIQYLLGALRRRWLVIAAPALIGGALATLIAFVLPPVYQSTARIIVESQQIPEDLARTTVSTNAAERIRLIEERLKSRQNLLELADRYGVFADGAQLSPTERVEKMRAATQIRMLGAARRRGSRTDTTLTTFEVSFSAERAAVAAQVANELLSQVLAENTQQRSTRAAETLAFFDREERRLGEELQAIETRIAEFRSENALSLPDQLDFRRSELLALERELFAADAQRVAMLDTRRQIVDALAAGRAATSDRTPAEQELDRLRAAYQQQSAVLTDSHPSMRNLQARIDVLEASLPRVSTPSAAPEDGSDAAEPTHPELVRIDAQIALLDQQRERQTARVAELKQAVEQAPSVGIRLNSLMRDYSAIQAQYNQAVAKRAEAATGARLEVNQQAERFEVIEEPQPSERPESPNRPMIASAGAVVSLGFGFGLVVLLELLNPAIRSARDLERRFDLRPSLVMPYIPTRGEQLRRTWAIRILAFCAVVVVPVGLWIVDQRVAPLPMLAERVMDRTGVSDVIDLIQRRFGG